MSAIIIAFPRPAPRERDVVLAQIRQLLGEAVKEGPAATPDALLRELKAINHKLDRLIA